MGASIVTIAFVIVVSISGVPVRLRPDGSAVSIGNAKQGAYQIVDTRLVEGETWVEIGIPGDYTGWILWDYNSPEEMRIKYVRKALAVKRTHLGALRRRNDDSRLAKIAEYR